MSEFVILGERFRADQGGRRQRTRTGQRRIERGLTVLLAAIATAVLGAAAFLVLPSTLRITRFEVSGARTMSEADVLRAALVHGNEYFFGVDPSSIRKALLSDPRIEEASVSLAFPNRLHISLTERTPAAIVIVEAGGRLQPVYIDAAGVAYAFASGKTNDSATDSVTDSATASARTDLPILSGLRFENFRPGLRLPAEFVPVLRSIGAIEESSPVLLQAFSEIKLVKPKYGEPELLLYSLHHRLPVRTGPVLNEATLRSIILVLDVLDSRGLADGAEEIDFRTGTVVYRVKGGQAG
jgi:cell division protein FtsQ